VVDHMHGDELQRDTLALQSSGWTMTTLTELRNRADLILLVGTDAGAYPRFYERCVWNARSLFGREGRRRELIYLGGALQTRAGISPAGRRPAHLRCDPRRLGEVLGALRALAAGCRLNADSIGGVERKLLQRLLERMRAARYGVAIWEPAAFDHLHAELIVENLCALVRTLNETTRFAGLSLGGDDGGMTATSVCTWQAGYPMRVSFASGHPEYEPTLHATERLLADGAIDRMLWLGGVFPAPPPPPAAAPAGV